MRETAGKVETVETNVAKTNAGNVPASTILPNSVIKSAQLEEEKISIAVKSGNFEQFKLAVASLLKVLNFSTSKLSASLSEIKIDNDTLLQYTLTQRDMTDDQKNIFKYLFELLEKELIANDKSSDILLFACKANHQELVYLLVPCYRKLSVNTRKVDGNVKGRIYSAIDSITSLNVLDCFNTNTDAENAIVSPTWKKEKIGNTEKTMHDEIKEKINKKRVELEHPYSNYLKRKANANPGTSMTLAASAFMFLCVAALSSGMACDDKGIHDFSHNCMKTLSTLLCGGNTQDCHALGLDFSPNNASSHKQSVLFFSTGVITAGLVGIGALVDWGRGRANKG